jgi:hypothetical protein
LIIPATSSRAFRIMSLPSGISPLLAVHSP